jgi:putative protease
MSPAGYWPQLHAAVEAGADSVYFGLRHFTARAKVGFDLDELPEAMRTLHRRGVRGFVTFNTLVFEHEFEEAARALARIVEAGADAIIVQDPGVLRLAGELAPELELHASTQLSVTDLHGVRWAARMGARRVTLARELSLAEIRSIAEQTDVELEVFVHGALCVAYSGQCFSSEAWGGRSANRGQCAQACRLPYELIVDGQAEPLGDARYLLSPGDLYALRQIPELIAMGIAAFKIEGRYKDADYVAAATAAYRKAVDEAWEGLPPAIARSEELNLEQVYSRGMGPHFLTGVNHQAVVRGRTPRHRGVLMGVVKRAGPEAVLVEPAEAHAISPLKPGDGVVFDAASWRSPEEAEEGGRVFGVEAGPRGWLEVRFGRDAIRWERVRPGDLLWRTHDPALEKALAAVTQPAAPLRKQAVDVEVSAEPGRPLRMCWRLRRDPSIEVAVQSAEPLAAARNRALSADSLWEQLARLGPTPYELAEVRLLPGPPVFAPASLLNQLRRDAVAALDERLARPPARTLRPTAAAALRARVRPEPLPTPAAPRLHLLVRTPEQLDAALACRPASITLDYLDLYGLKPSVERVKASGIVVRVATPRILKPGEERMTDFLLRLDCPILVRPAGLAPSLRERTEHELTGDFSLNAANKLTAALLLDQGLARVTPGHDLNAAQVAELARDVGAARLEVIAYQHLPVFHTEHCVFCRFLSSGASYKDCGRPCEKHRVALRDSSGRSHPLMADAGCRNTVFGAEAQEASAYLEEWLDAGIRHFRLEFVHEDAAAVRGVAESFAEAFAARLSFRQLGARLRKLAPQGSTQGSLYVPANHPALPILQ